VGNKEGNYVGERIASVWDWRGGVFGDVEMGMELVREATRQCQETVVRTVGGWREGGGEGDQTGKYLNI